jgi:hypothetical protein
MIHEGTHGIRATDLLGRKVDGGRDLHSARPHSHDHRTGCARQFAA